MGNCAKDGCGKTHHHYEDALDRFDAEPEDTIDYIGKNLPQLHFHAMLRKVKIKNSNQKKLNVNFIIDSIDELELPEKGVDGSHKAFWNIDEKFAFSLTEYELRKKFLIIEVQEAHATISTLKINLYLISTGPYHLDFALPIEGGKDNNKCRISFDLKISQVVDMQLSPSLIELIEDKESEFVEDQFTFSMKAIIGASPLQSGNSSAKKVEQERLGKHKIALKWDSASESLPILKGNYPFYQFHYATLKILFARMSSEQKSESEKIIAECYISFVKLLGFDSIVVERNNKFYEVKNISLEEKVWLNGKQCGKVKIKMKFEIEKNIKQMLVCVRTEKGISKSSLVFQQQRGKKSSCSQIQELQKLYLSIIQEQNELTKLKVSKNHSFMQMNTHSHKIEKFLRQQQQLLKKASKQTILIYSYASEEELMRGQSVLLMIGETVLRFIDEQVQVDEELKWKVLSILVIRGEFNLNYIGFDSLQEKGEKFLQRKREIGVKFQQFIYEMLRLTIHILGMKGLNQEKRFAQSYSAVAYFRIPEFRKILLDLIVRADDPEISEWRGTDFSLTNQSKDFKTYLPGENTFQILFDWEKYFYKHIESAPRYDKNIEKLREILENKEWEKRILKRRGAFFSFIHEWVKFVSKISVRIVHSNWKYFPGYIQILKCFLSELKIRQISQLPSSIKNASNSLLSNQNLLNIFVTIIFNKTNINNSFDVLKILELCGNFFSALKNQNKRIPSTFNYNFFFNGIKMILDNQYSFTTGRALHLFYEHFEEFSEQFKIEVSNYLLGKIFFKLFLHWSKNVRLIFHHLLVVRVNINAINVLKDVNIPKNMREAARAISNRYSCLLVILENLKKIKSKEYIPSTEDQLYKKMRNRLRKTKRQSKNGNDNKDLKIKLPTNKDSEDLGSSTMRENQRMMEQLGKPQIQRYDSQILAKKIQIAFEENPQKVKDEVVRRKGSIKFKSYDDGEGEDQENYKGKSKGKGEGQGQGESLTEEKKKISNNNLRYNVQKLNEDEMPIVTQEEISYVKLALPQFTGISANYEKSLKLMKGAPILKMEVMLDSGEIRPQNFTEAEEW